MRRALELLLALALAAPAAANSLLLDATTKSLELETSSSASTDWIAAWADNTTTAFTPGMSQGNVASATTTAIVAAPAASTQRQVKWISVRNRSTTASQTVTLKLDVSATEFHIGPAITLAAGEALQMDADGNMILFSATGLVRSIDTPTAGYNGKAYGFAKTGSAKDASGYWYSFGKDVGYPGAMALGTPGLNGLATACDVVGTTAGALALGTHVIQDPSTGSLFLSEVGLSQSIGGEIIGLIDVLWFNTGINVTTTTGQAVTFPGLPARDINGSTDGKGVEAALLTTTANTNAGVITNTTLTYTDDQGNASNTATFQAVVGWQAPATPVAGTWMRFALAAGDSGIRSVQTITLGTSYGGGALSLVLYRPLVTVPIPTANTGFPNPMLTPPGTRIYNDTCLWLLDVGTATGASLTGTVTIVER